MTHPPARATWLDVSLLFVPSTWALACDCVRRADRIVELHRWYVLGWVVTSLASAVAWAVLLCAASRARAKAASALAAVVFVGLFALSYGVQGAFFALYDVYSAVDSQVDSRSSAWSIVASLPIDARFGIHVAIAAAVAIGSVAVSRRRPALGTITDGWVFAASLAALVWFYATPTSYRQRQANDPALLYFQGLRAAVHENLAEQRGEEPRLVRVDRRTPAALPALARKPARPRNVVMLLQEAQRADVTCTAYAADCTLATPSTNLTSVDRLPLLQMRAVGSSTAVAIATLWSGLSPTASRSDIHSAPLLWEYAHAAGYRTAYFTSQHLMFQNSRLFVQGMPLDAWVTATHLEPLADILAGASDFLLSERALAEVADLEEPFFAVVHYSNIHKPRIIDPDDAPFQPTDTDMKREHEQPQKNFYKNSVYRSDKAVARFITGLRGLPAGERTVIVFLSDHGESYYEHNQDNNHSGSVFDEEVHVPAWVDGPEGTLDRAEIDALASARDAYVFETDVAPTVLDLLGVWDDPNIERWRGSMIGSPLTRQPRSDVPVPMTNVCWTWEYQLPNWGVMQGSRKLHARAKDERYRCYDVKADPREKHPLPADACTDLEEAANATFHMLPKDLGRLSRRPDWGSGL